jgi:hypothetical protein
MIRILHVIALSAAVALAFAQSEPANGPVSGNVYSNELIGLTWDLPADWAVDGTNPKSEIEGSHSHRLVRLIAGGSEASDWVEMYWSDRDSQYIENPSQQLSKKAWESIQGNGYYTLGGGVRADRYDYKSTHLPIRYLSIIVGRRHNRGLALLFAANSPNRIQDLIKAALIMKIKPDWPRGGQGRPVPPLTPGSFPVRVRVSEGVSNGLLDHKVQPTYPLQAQLAHVQGQVLMVGHIGTDGVVEDLYVEAGHPLLIPSSLEAVSQWRFRPYLLQGKPVEVETQIVVNFQMH